MKNFRILLLFLSLSLLIFALMKMTESGKKETPQTNTQNTETNTTFDNSDPSPDADSIDIDDDDIDDGTGTVAIVYPRNAASITNYCYGKSGDNINSTFVIDGKYAICGVAKGQLKGTYQNYNSDGFCKCLSQYCNKSKQATQFLNCIDKYKGKRN